MTKMSACLALSFSIDSWACFEKGRQVSNALPICNDISDFVSMTKGLPAPTSPSVVTFIVANPGFEASGARNNLKFTYGKHEMVQEDEMRMAIPQPILRFKMSLLVIYVLNKMTS